MANNENSKPQKPWKNPETWRMGVPGEEPAASAPSEPGCTAAEEPAGWPVESASSQNTARREIRSIRTLPRLD
jgi:hypothetical protein